MPILHAASTTPVSHTRAPKKYPKRWLVRCEVLSLGPGRRESMLHGIAVLRKQMFRLKCHRSCKACKPRQSGAGARMHWIATVMQRDSLSWAFPSIGPKVMLKCKEDCVCLCVCVCDRVDQVFGLHRQLERDRVNFCRSKTYRPTLCRACCGSQCGSHLCRDVFSTPRRHHVGCKPHTALNPKPNVHTQCDPPPSRLHNEQLSWPDPSGQQQGFQTAAKQLDAATDVRRL